MRKTRIKFLTLCLLVGACWAPALAPAQTKSNDAANAPPASSSKTESTKPPSQAEIAAAKAAGKVWVNLNSGVYHKSGRWYGKTKNGSFMTEDEARKAGYKPAHRD